MLKHQNSDDQTFSSWRRGTLTKFRDFRICNMIHIFLALWLEVNRPPFCITHWRRIFKSAKNLGWRNFVKRPKSFKILLFWALKIHFFITRQFQKLTSSCWIFSIFPAFFEFLGGRSDLLKSKVIPQIFYLLSIILSVVHLVAMGIKSIKRSQLRLLFEIFRMYMELLYYE